MAFLSKEQQNELVQATLAGDKDAAAQLYGFVTPIIRRQLIRIIPREDIDDVTQETMIKAFSRLDNFSQDAQFSTWCVVIAKTTALDLLRSQKRTQEVVVASIDEPMKSPNGGARRTIDVGYEDRTAEQNLAYADVHEGIEKLSTTHRLVLRMYLDDKTNNEIATVLGTSLGNAKIILARAKKSLREAIENGVVPG
jgi:RNA polymerase sigma-70 factor (ECF subfamily)